MSRPSPPSWIHSRELWAGLSIVTMWLAVLFVGVFGENIVSTSSGGSASVPVVVVLLPFVLPASIVAAVRGFRERADESPQSFDERIQASAGPAATSPTEPSQLRSKVA
jgi:hypothetical protein